jgi:16S rRNA (cytosine967-C5)-methyltransferase
VSGGLQDAAAQRLTPPQFEAAVAATGLVLQFSQPADAVLSTFFRQHRSGARDRAFIAETAYAVLRRKRWLERLAGAPPLQPSARQLVLLALSRLRGLSARQLEPALAKGDAEWLAECRARPELALSLAEQADLPDWVVARLEPALGAERLLALARALNAPAPLDLRANLLKATRDEVITRLAADRIAAEPCRFAPQGLRLKGHPALQKHPAFLDGSFEVQDEGSQLLAHLVQPRRGELVVDFCAGAGGKTLALGALMRSTGRLYAFDVSEKRLARLKPRAARAGLSNVHPIAIASENDARARRLAGKADRVLVDAPCSGLGTLRRNPDLKWRQTETGVVELCAKQAAILAAAARLVRPGGRLVYATCSILAEENEAVVDAFLAAQPEFRRLPVREILAAQGVALDTGEDLRLSPEVHGTDGFYAAVLERANA